MTQAGLPPLPQPPTLSALQDYVRRMVKARGFYTDPDKIFILLVEEVGELAAELRHRAHCPERFDRRNLSHELIDILLYLLDLANGFSVKLELLWPEHERRSAAPHGGPGQGRGQTAGFRADFSLNELYGHVERGRTEREKEDSGEMPAIRLSEEVGELARELRKHWKGRAEPRDVGMAIIGAITCALRVGACFDVDFEAALAEKERLNAARHWAY